MTDNPHHLICDCSTGYMTIVPLTDDEIAEQTANISAWEAASSERENVILLQQITSIEQSSGLPRAVRDLVLSNTSAPAYTRTKAVDDQIGALRAQLVAVT